MLFRYRFAPTLYALLFLIILTCHPLKKVESDFIAFSLREASLKLSQGENATSLMNLGGISRLGGLVYDRVNKDIILYGLKDKSLPGISIDDLIVALKARIVYNLYPLVSIDPTPETQKTKIQKVRFDGNIQNTAFGKSALDADILLKLYSLGKADSIRAIKPYFLLMEDDIKNITEGDGLKVNTIKWVQPDSNSNIIMTQQGSKIKDTYSFQSRFWFYVKEPYIYSDANDVFCLKELHIAVKNEFSSLQRLNRKQFSQDQYVTEWTNNFNVISDRYPNLKKLKTLYDLVAVAEAIKKIDDTELLKYLIFKTKPTYVYTPDTYSSEELVGIVERSDGLKQLFQISGGIDYKTEIKWLNYGDFSPLRDIVINSRPSPDALTWVLPLDGWKMQNAFDLDLHTVKNEESQPVHTNSNSGCSFVTQSVVLDPGYSGTGPVFQGFQGPDQVLPALNGVSMEMVVDNKSFQQDESGELEKTSKKILEDRPDKNTLSWPSKNKN
jgi:hypothetical protein